MPESLPVSSSEVLGLAQKVELWGLEKLLQVLHWSGDAGERFSKLHPDDSGFVFKLLVVSMMDSAMVVSMVELKLAKRSSTL